jgi:DNA primase
MNTTWTLQKALRGAPPTEIDRHLDLAPSGNTMKGRCPYLEHEDENPSFYIYPGGRFHCYGCRRQGDVVDLRAALKGLSPGIEAVLDFATRWTRIGIILSWRKEVRWIEQSL